MWTKTLIIIILLLCLSVKAQASCTGSGLAWSCTSGTTVSQINSCISSASDGATITFDSGNYTWGSTINLSTTKGVTLLCSSKGNCTVNASGMQLSLVNWNTTNIKLYRISGFTFNNPGSFWLWFYCYLTTGKLTQVRVDNNSFNLSGADVDLIVFGESSSTSKTTIYGLIDNNTITNTSNNTRVVVYYGPKDWSIDKIGTSENLFIEDNTFNFASQTNAGLGAIDGRDGAGWVFRHNTVINGRIESHGYYGGFTGFTNSEIYNNQSTFNNGDFTNGYRAIHHQGSGEWIVFNNTVTAITPYSGSGIAMQNYRSSSEGHYGLGQCNGSDSEDGNRTPLGTYYGYPCNKQLGRNINGVLKPVYFWNNKWNSGTSIAPAVDGVGGTDYVSYHLHSDRDYYTGGVITQTSSSSPFNGTTGIGFGTLANRPATCTPTPESADAGYGGVGYFATDQGTQGTLYRCSATNTWTASYTPYIYPHPLQGVGSSPATPSGIEILYD